ncbi:hypothetical protein B0A52_03407 [Exophiala mesophila]|uniref:Cupin type-2 domain-containing protein n=1 Tax=Exophiala mesophila TaxID=212818 RepID=A0A438N5Z8_EXOME|nr:hypothetical protein B0A52_03407 [Exophiala mesophila]
MAVPDIHPETNLPNPTIHITAHNPDGTAKVLSSYKSPGKEYPGITTHHHLAYTTASMPVELSEDVDVKLHQDYEKSGNLAIVKPNGTVCRLVDIGPGNPPAMHRTQSLDYGVVIAGEVIMELDDGSTTLMKPGDVAVQRGTNHAWKNPSPTQWARMLFVLQDCKPIYVGGQRFKEDLGIHGKKIFPDSGNDA